MHGPECLPYRPTRALPRRPELAPGSKIFQPTDSRQSGPEFGPAPRSGGGAPGWVEEEVATRSDSEQDSPPSNPTSLSGDRVMERNLENERTD